MPEAVSPWTIRHGARRSFLVVEDYEKNCICTVFGAQRESYAAAIAHLPVLVDVLSRHKAALPIDADAFERRMLDLFDFFMATAYRPRRGELLLLRRAQQDLIQETFGYLKLSQPQPKETIHE